MIPQKNNNLRKEIEGKTINNRNKFLRLLIEERPISLSIIILLIIITGSILHPETFFSVNNFRNILHNMVSEAIIAIGMTILLISKGFDLSVGPTMFLVGGVTAYSIKFWGGNVFFAILLGLVVAVAVGMLNGFIIAKIGVNPLITTIATMGGIGGLVVLICGTGIIKLGETFTSISTTKFLTFSIQTWVMLVLLILFSYLLHQNRFFRQYYFIGGNELSAVMSGINVAKVKIIAYIMSAVCAGIAGILYTSRLNAALGQIPGGIEFRVITAIVLGGATLAGGRGTIIGSFLGVFLIALINNLLIIGLINPYWNSIILAIVLLMVVTLDEILRRRQSDL